MLFVAVYQSFAQFFCSLFFFNNLFGCGCRTTSHHGRRTQLRYTKISPFSILLILVVLVFLFCYPNALSQWVTEETSGHLGKPVSTLLVCVVAHSIPRGNIFLLFYHYLNVNKLISFQSFACRCALVAACTSISIRQHPPPKKATKVPPKKRAAPRIAWYPKKTFSLVIILLIIIILILSWCAPVVLQLVARCYCSISSH